MTGCSNDFVIASLIFTLPFLVESIISARDMLRTNEHVNVELKETLLESNGESDSDQSLVDKLEESIYQAVDDKFMPKFCKTSMKQDLFSKSSAKHMNEQVFSLSIIFLELYLGILSVTSTLVAPIMSSFVILYSLFSLYSYFGLPTIKVIQVSQSYFAATKLSAFCLGYLFDSICYGSFQASQDLSFALMTLVLTFDALYGFNNLVSQEHVELDRPREDISNMLITNWKSHLFFSGQSSIEKTLAFGLLTLQDILSFSAIFAFSGSGVIVRKFHI